VIPSALIVALLLGVAGAESSSASPPPSTAIAVILPRGPNGPMVEALNRLRGEAESVGLELRLYEGPTGAEPRAELDAVARALAPAAVVALVSKVGDEASPGAPGASGGESVAPRLGSMDVWFLDRVTGKVSVGHLTVEEEAGSRADLVLAVRVVDFIRARMFDSLVRALAERRPQPRKKVVHALAGRGFAAAGVATTGSFAGFPAALMPCLQLGYAVKNWLRLDLGYAGSGGEPRRETAAGSVTLDQTWVKASATLQARAWWRIFPFVEAGALAYFVSAHGVGTSGNIGYDPSGWSPGGLVTAGLGIVLASHLALQLDGGAIFLAREPKVYIADVEVARTGRPAWLASAQIGVTF
jgi:hypothetical protein